MRLVVVLCLCLCSCVGRRSWRDVQSREIIQFTEFTLIQAEKTFSLYQTDRGILYVPRASQRDSVLLTPSGLRAVGMLGVP